MLEKWAAELSKAELAVMIWPSGHRTAMDRAAGPP